MIDLEKLATLICWKCFLTYQNYIYIYICWHISQYFVPVTKIPFTSTRIKSFVYQLLFTFIFLLMLLLKYIETIRIHVIHVLNYMPLIYSHNSQEKKKSQFSDKTRDLNFQFNKNELIHVQYFNIFTNHYIYGNLKLCWISLHIFLYILNLYDMTHYIIWSFNVCNRSIKGKTFQHYDFIELAFMCHIVSYTIDSFLTILCQTALKLWYFILNKLSLS